MKSGSIKLAFLLATLLGPTLSAAAQTPINVSYQVTIHGIPLYDGDAESTRS